MFQLTAKIFSIFLGLVHEYRDLNFAFHSLNYFEVQKMDGHSLDEFQILCSSGTVDKYYLWVLPEVANP